MGSPDYTKAERAALNEVLRAFMPTDTDLETTRKNEIEDALSNYACADIKELKEKFGPGSHGHSQSIDRIYMQAQVWDEYICEDPTLSLDAETYELAHIISCLMGDLYQKVACADVDDAQEAKTESEDKSNFMNAVDRLVSELKSSQSEFGKSYRNMADQIKSEYQKTMAAFKKELDSFKDGLQKDK